MFKSFPELLVHAVSVFYVAKEIKDSHRDNNIYKDLYHSEIQNHQVTSALLKQEQEHAANMRGEVLNYHANNLDLIQNIREVREELWEYKQEVGRLRTLLEENGINPDEEDEDEDEDDETEVDGRHTDLSDL